MLCAANAMAPPMRAQFSAFSLVWRDTHCKRALSFRVHHARSVPRFACIARAMKIALLSDIHANLLQAQRDYFGAHTYERTDKPRGEFFHTNWTGTGGDTASTTYDV